MLKYKPRFLDAFRAAYGPNALNNLLYYVVPRLSTSYDVQLVRQASLLILQ